LARATSRAAHHEHQRRGLRAHLGARGRGVDHGDAARRESLRRLHGEPRLAGRRVDQELAAVEPFDESVGAERDVADVGARRQHRDHHVGRARDVARRRGHAHAGVRGGDALGLRAVDVEHGELVACLREMAGHRRAHDA
jgi:hypothetical protein